MIPDLYANKPRDFIVDSGHLAIAKLKERRCDYRAVIPGNEAGDEVKKGMQIVRLLEESGSGRKPTDKYFIIIVHDVITRLFGELQLDETFLEMTPEKDGSLWAASMQKAYATKKNATGELAFPDGLHIETPFTVYWFTPVMTSNAQEFLMAQYLFYAGALPPQIESEWKEFYGNTAIQNVTRRIKKLAQ